MKINNINLLGLSETKLQDKKARFIYKNHEKYTAFFNNDSTNINGFGVGILLIDNHYAHYVHTKVVIKEELFF